MIDGTIKSGGTLVIQPLPGIGDTVWHLPHLKAISDRTQNKQITLLTKERSMARQLLAGTRFIRQVLYLTRDGGRHSGLLGGWKLGKDLRSNNFESVWILHNSIRYALAASRAGIKERIGYGIGWQNALLTTTNSLSWKEKNLKTIAKATRLLKNHDIDLVSTQPELHLTKEARRSAEILVCRVEKPRIAIAMGSSEPFKQWGEENFTKLIKQLRTDHVTSVILLGGKNDIQMANRISIKLSEPKWLIKAIDLPILEAAAIAGLCQICIGNDTGMLNIAAAVGTKSIGLFGGSTPEINDRRIIKLSPPGLVAAGRNRMDEITTNMVIDSLINLRLF